MKVKNCSLQTLELALRTVNHDHGYSLIFNRFPEKIGNFLHFTIRSTRSGIPGARLSSSGRNIPAASWHAHGYLFEEILRLSPTAIIHTYGRKIHLDSNGSPVNLWVDWNIGTNFCPIQFSETSIL